MKIIKYLLTLSLLSSAAFAQEGQPAAEKPKPNFEAMFKKLDANGDGKISLEEFTGKRDPAKAKAAFEKKDKNKDGFITMDEFVPAPKKAKAE